ncbi:glycosyltransferase family 4 protein [Rossellomorea marisflavi]|uniref:glycosyltransferase family 4 protein n=1 Tax=Rossellomorea marisflavi TaxID=189381 RepID=UPI0011E8726C|nr:glycosyltransferase [Rossellomorea marisflavi]TYO74368.1 glycosyltransferase [Rossellomorea marisflavi]
MNILVVSPYYPIKNRNHLISDTKAVHYFTREWVKLGHKVMVIHTYFHSVRNIIRNRLKSEVYQDMSRSYSLDEIDGVKIALLENQWLIPKSSFMFNWQNKRQTKFVLNVLKEENFVPDIIVTHFPTYYLDLMEDFKANFNCPSVAVLHRSDIEVLAKKGKLFRERLLDQYQGFGFRSSIIQKRFGELNNTYNNGFLVLSGAPDKFLINKSQLRPINTKLLRILYVGKLVKNKNVDKVLNSLACVKEQINFHFTIIGNGPERENINAQVAKLGLNSCVSLIASTSRENVLSLMGKSDIFIMISKNETFGLVYLEAMASGCIAIGSAKEGIDGVIQNNVNGYLINNGNEEELANLLIKISKMDTIRLENIRAAAHQTAVNLTETKMAISYLNNLISIKYE